MNIKITFDPDGVYGYPKDGIIDGKQLVNDYIDTLNEVEDANTISFLKSSEIEKAVDFVAEMWKIDYEFYNELSNLKKKGKYMKVKLGTFNESDIRLKKDKAVADSYKKEHPDFKYFGLKVAKDKKSATLYACNNFPEAMSI